MWTFSLPTKVTFGAGTAREAARCARDYGARPIIVTDSVLAGLPHIQELAASFGDVPLFSDLSPNPTVAQVDALAERIRTEFADVVVAIGGGSPMDCAKAAAALCAEGGVTIRPYHSEGKTFSAEPMPLIALPTTSGTGAEVTPFSVLNDEAKGIKGPIASDVLYPALALVDPELTYTLPRSVTAATGLDALCHAIEGYWSRNHQPICDTLAIEAAKLVFQYLETCCTRPEDEAARSGMSYAALLAGMAFQLPKNAMVHACSFPLSNRFHLPHGVACAFSLEFAIRLNTPHMDGRMDCMAEACGFRNIEAMAKRIRELKVLGGLPCTLAEAGIPREAVPELVQESFHPLMDNNPKKVTEEDLKALYASLSI